MLRITFPYLLFISMTGVAGGILNSYDRFAVPAFTPLLLNISMIFAALIAAPWFDQPTYALAWGVFAAGHYPVCFSAAISGAHPYAAGASGRLAASRGEKDSRLNGPGDLWCLGQPD